MTEYDEALDWLYTQLPMFQRVGAPAYKPGLDTSHMLDDATGNPHRRYRTIHVAGTNGKGSTAHTIAAVLQAAGYRTGLYTSPHLVDFRERIRGRRRNGAEGLCDWFRAAVPCHGAWVQAVVFRADDGHGFRVFRILQGGCGSDRGRSGRTARQYQHHNSRPVCDHQYIV